MRETVHIGGQPRTHVPVLSRERLELLHAYGLNETDLAYMGANQRALVEAVLSLESRAR